LPTQRDESIFQQAILQSIRVHSPAMRQRSHLQSFDAKEERQKADSDFKYAISLATQSMEVLQLCQGRAEVILCHGASEVENW
jgi:hypothetical protein